MFNKTDIEKYFNAEKSESLLFLLVGIAAILAAASFFLFIKTNFYKGAAVPLLLVGLLLGVVGFTVYKRSDADRVRNVYAYDLNPSELKQKEIPRMQTVMKNFVLYRWVEIALVITGVVLFFYFKNNIDQQFWKGFGLSLAIMAFVALSADYFAEKRGDIYLQGLITYLNK
jgi:drug/metabolite transporter (DMT)-like permease